MSQIFEFRLEKEDWRTFSRSEKKSATRMEIDW